MCVFAGLDACMFVGACKLVGACVFVGECVFVGACVFVGLLGQRCWFEVVNYLECIVEVFYVKLFCIFLTLQGFVYHCPD